MISIGERAERLHVEITDDGVGGAALGGGSGLSGLADRVAALGGTFELDSPPGRRDAIVRRAAAPGADPLTARQGMSRTGGPTRRQGPPAHTTASPGFIGGSGSSWIVPSASRANSNVRVLPPQSNTSRLPTIS